MAKMAGPLLLSLIFAGKWPSYAADEEARLFFTGKSFLLSLIFAGKWPSYDDLKIVIQGQAP
jgi:hypothetical protein